MKDKRIELSRSYHATLQNYLKQGSNPNMEPARELGRFAMRLGLETLDLARIHEIAVASLVLPSIAGNSKAIEKLMSRSGMFFAEAITPIEETHRGAREANVHLNQMLLALSQRTRELADSVEELKIEIEQRTTMEVSLRISQQTSSELLTKSREMQEELRTLTRQLLSAQEEERKRISRELHDVIAQTLTGINVKLSALKVEAASDNKNLEKKIVSTQRLVEKSVDIVHRFARELRPSVLDDLGLIPALQAYLKQYTEDTGIRVSLKAFAGIEKSSAAQRTALYRIAQEALTNVARHSGASHADVIIHEREGVTTMEIKDDGKGFEVDGTSRAKNSIRLGLLGMRERMEMVGGTFCVISAPDKHTTVRVELPSIDSPHPNKPTKKPAKTSTLKCP